MNIYDSGREILKTTNKISYVYLKNSQQHQLDELNFFIQIRFAKVIHIDFMVIVNKNTHIPLQSFSIIVFRLNVNILQLGFH